MNANPVPLSNVVPQSGQVVQDEWGIFNPRPASARPIETHGSPSPADGAQPTHCAFCSEPLSPTSRYCSRCLRQVGGKTSEIQEAPVQATTQAPPVKSPSVGGALYTLESPARCPECEKEIRTFRVLRVLRTQVSFTSTLPRKGYVIVCPECERLLSAELSGLV